MKLTYIVTYYNQIDGINEQMKLWDSYDEEIKNRLRFLIIDDGSQNKLEPLTNIDIDLIICRVEEDIPCNIGGARNLGSHVCDSEWMMHHDVDHKIPQQMAKELLNIIDNDEERKTIYRFNRRDEKGNTKIHPGSMLLTKQSYWDVGGCDEDFVGNYGQTDVHFFIRAKEKLIVKELNHIFMDYFPEYGADINRDTAINQKLLMEKVKNNSWSDYFLRFDWYISYK